MNKLIKTGIVSFIPATPAVVGRPAYCQTEYKQQQEIIFEDGILKIIVKDVPVTVCYPAIPSTPAIPSEESVKPMTGWNAGAISNQFYEGDCEFSFNVTVNPVGIICGLTNWTALRNYYHIKHGFYFKADEQGGSTPQVAIIESGVIQKVLTNIELMYMPLFMVRASQGNIYYLVDNEIVHVSHNTMTGDIYASSTLYLINDSVDNPVFKKIADIASVELPLMASGGNVEGNYASIRLDPFNLEATSGNYANIKLELEVNSFQGEYAGINAKLEPFTIEAVSDSAPSITASTLTIALDPFYIEPTFIPNGGVASLALPLDLKLGVITDYPYYATANIVLSALELNAKSYPEQEGVITHQEYLVLNTESLIDTAFIMVFAESLTINSIVDIGLVFNINIAESLLINDQVSLSHALTLLIQEKIRIASHANAPKQTSNYQYAVNVANFALSLYDNFDFTSFTYCNGVTYGIKADGLYRLTGVTDNGQLIKAEIDVGTKDWGSPNIKRVSSAYVGIRSDGDVYLKVIADDGEEKIYRFEERESQRREFMAKGVAGRYWRVRLILDDVSYAEVDSLEFEVGVSQRRI